MTHVPKPTDLCATCGGSYEKHNYSDTLDSPTDPLGHMYECGCRGGTFGNWTCPCRRFVARLATLTFAELRKANVERTPRFKNKRGVAYHPNGIRDWTAPQWLMATLSELGELAGLLKDLESGEADACVGTRQDLAKEFADVVCYLDCLAERCGVDLGDAVRQKFNEVSAKIDCAVKL